MCLVEVEEDIFVNPAHVVSVMVEYTETDKTLDAAIFIEFVTGTKKRIYRESVEKEVVFKGYRNSQYNDNGQADFIDSLYKQFLERRKHFINLKLKTIQSSFLVASIQQ